MTQIRISEAAELLGVSSDTVRRWIEHGHLRADKDHAGRLAVSGAELAQWAHELANSPTGPHSTSARNRLNGLVTDVKSDAVMAQITMQCGPYRVVSLMSAEAVHDLGLEVGSIARAVIKSTNVIVEKQ